MKMQTKYLKLKNFADTSRIGGFLHKIYMREKTNRKFKKLNLNRLRFVKGMNLDTLGIEFTSICDLNCRWCSLDRTKRKGFMRIELLEKLLKEIVKKEHKIKTLALHHAGETTLHPKLKEMLNLIGKYKKEHLNFPKVSLLTNANQLTGEKSKIIIDSNAIDWMRFSVDGGNKKDFEYMRRGAKWERILKNVQNFLNMNNGKISTSIFTILNNHKKFSKEFLELVKKVDEHKIVFPHNWGGEIKFEKNKHKTSTTLTKYELGGCARALHSITILWSGEVVPCCIDLNGKEIIGDLNKKTLLEIYRGEKRINILNKMKKNKRFEIKLCKNCSEV